MAPWEVVALTGIYAVCSTVVVTAATGVGVSTQEYCSMVELALGLKAVTDVQDGFATAEVTLKVSVAGSRVHAVEESFELSWMRKVESTWVYVVSVNHQSREAPTILTVAPWQVPFADGRGEPDGRGNRGGDVPVGETRLEVVKGMVAVGSPTGDGGRLPGEDGTEP